jgi:hypothetical protein
MSARFVIPDWMVPDDPPPTQPDLSEVDQPHRVEALVNRFIGAKQDALFTAPDAYYRTIGVDAVDGAPAVLGRLKTLRDAMLEQAGNDNMRAALGPRLELHIATPPTASTAMPRRNAKPSTGESSANAKR